MIMIDCSVESNVVLLRIEIRWIGEDKLNGQKHRYTAGT